MNQGMKLTFYNCCYGPDAEAPDAEATGQLLTELGEEQFEQVLVLNKY